MHRYERWFLNASIAVLILFIAIIGYGAVVANATVPGSGGLIDPATIFQDPRFQEPYVRPVEDAPGQYDAWVVALQFAFIPQEIAVPANSTVTFHMTAVDVIHGFFVPGTSVNAMVVPGYITTFTLDFGAPGRLGVVCDEYCGAGHHFMNALIVVEEAGAGAGSNGGNGGNGGAGGTIGSGGSGVGGGGR